jgi:hypothetical protein
MSKDSPDQIRPTEDDAVARQSGSPDIEEDLGRSPALLVSDFAMSGAPSIDIPSMLCQPEKDYYYWITSNVVSGAGAVVEFGTWLGGSTAYLSAGLRGRVMHCYDHFVWFGYDNWKSDVKLNDGDDFAHLFLENVERYKVNAVIHKTKLEEAEWNDGPVELLIFDAPKRASQLARLLTVFAPNIIPGRTRIVLQDYQHFPSYELAVVMDAIRSSVALEHVVVALKDNKQPNTVSFLVTGPIDTAPLASVAEEMVTWSPERIRTTWLRMMEPLPDQARARMAPGLALFLYDAGHTEEATDTLVKTPMHRIMLNRWRRLCGPVPYFDFPDRYRLLVSAMDATWLNPDWKAAAPAVVL